MLNHCKKINNSGQQRLLKITKNCRTLLFTLVTMGDQLKIFFAASFASMRSTQLYQNIPHLPKHSVLERLKTRKRAHFRVLHPCTPNSTLFRVRSIFFIAIFQLIPWCSLDLSNKNETWAWGEKWFLIPLAGLPENRPKRCTNNFQHPQKPTSENPSKSKLPSFESQYSKVPVSEKSRPSSVNAAAGWGGKEKNLGSCVGSRDIENFWKKFVFK